MCGVISLEINVKRDETHIYGLHMAYCTAMLSLMRQWTRARALREHVEGDGMVSPPWEV